jgi:hypothetical protein
VIDDAHPHRLGPRGDLLADPSKPEDAQGFAVELALQREPCGNRRASDTISPIVISAIASLRTLGVFVTRMFRALAALVSIES